MRNKSAFTLIELLVYMAIMGFIIVVAGKVFSDSTVMRVRSQNMLKSAEVSGRISELLKEDISQMGVKAWGQSSASSYVVNVNPEVYWDKNGNDFSSYALFRNEPKSDNYFDKLVFKKAEFDDKGVLLGVREISYWVENGNLYRICRTIDPAACKSEDTDCSNNICPTEDPKSVLIGSNLKKFFLTPSKPGMSNNPADNDVLLPPPGVTPVPDYTFSPRNSGDNVKSSINITGNSSTEIVVSSFSARNIVDSESAKNFNQVYLVLSGKEWNECADMSLKEGETYVVEFEMPFFKGAGVDNANDSNSTQFLPGMDHIAIGFRNKNGETPPGAPSDIQFYPPQSKEADDMKRHAEFSISKDIDNACVALTFAFYSPKAGKGKLRFKNFAVFRKADEAFHFPKDIEYGTEDFADKVKLKEQKRNVKAFELVMEIEHNGEKVRTYSSEDNGMIITTPNNGITAQASTPP